MTDKISWGLIPQNRCTPTVFVIRQKETQEVIASFPCVLWKQVKEFKDKLKEWQKTARIERVKPKTFFGKITGHDFYTKYEGRMFKIKEYELWA